MFQPSVLKTYLARQDQAVIDRQYKKFRLYFGNETIQNNILASNEEQLQGAFCEELFGNILSYTCNPAPNFNFQWEVGNKKIDATKSDAAILVDNVVKAVIELKDKKTKTSDKIEAQAFLYHSKQRQCVYIITSNYQNLWFYINKVEDKIQFDLFNLDREQFALLYLCLSWESIRQDLPQKILNESVTEEEDITKNLYTDYSTFKQLLFDDLCAKNPQFDKLTLFKKTQKLLDRLLFIFFAEDRDLLRANEIERIVTDWKELKKKHRISIPLYDRFKDYFGYLNTGDADLDIFPYNGGLFLPDEILDAVAIDDTLLAEHSRKLAGYDFASDVDVNILGHIFEHSLTETEEKTAELTGQAPTKQNRKRKKDGIFYTPKYITAYIVEQTVGKLCEAKRLELGIDTIAEAAEEIKPKNAKQKKEQEKLYDKLDENLTKYRNWLLELKICDPACGSGAFLNQALEFLINEHRKIDELVTLAKFGQTKGVIIFKDYETTILENNLYGVDINDESVDIAKLSLWLRSAKKGRKLNHLSHRLKLGNSLIDDRTIAGEKAFHWQTEFPEVFDKENPGFDVVIGNPPYVQLQSLGDGSTQLSKCGYATFERTGDLYCLFYERGIQLLKSHGYLGYITSNKWLRTGYGESLRRYLTAQVNPLQIIDFPGVSIFPDAVVDPLILLCRNEPYVGATLACTCDSTEELNRFTETNNIPITFSSDSWTIQSGLETAILKKMKNIGTPLKELPVSIYFGIKTAYDKAFYIDTETKERLVTQDPKSVEILHPLLRGRDIMAYGCDYADLWLINPHNGIKEKNILPIDITNYPAVQSHLDQYYPQLIERQDQGETPYNLRNCAYLEEFSKPKIVYPNMTKFFPFMLDKQGYLTNPKCFIMTALNDDISLEYLVAIFNSKLAKLWIWYNCSELLGGTREILKIFFENFPVAISSEPRILSTLAEKRISLTTQLQLNRRNFLKLITDNFPGVKTTRVLENFTSLSFADFLNEMKKQKHPIPLKSQSEWNKCFTQAVTECRQLSETITKTDTEIDRLVYELYALTAEEIRIIEGGK